jgi:competence transcription factor ComK
MENNEVNKMIFSKWKFKKQRREIGNNPIQNLFLIPDNLQKQTNKQTKKQK